jgi:hypothetical protein
VDTDIAAADTPVAAVDAHLSSRGGASRPHADDGVLLLGSGGRALNAAAAGGRPPVASFRVPLGPALASSVLPCECLVRQRRYVLAGGWVARPIVLGGPLRSGVFSFLIYYYSFLHFSIENKGKTPLNALWH